MTFDVRNGVYTGHSASTANYSTGIYSRYDAGTFLADFCNVFSHRARNIYVSKRNGHLSFENVEKNKKFVAQLKIFPEFKFCEGVVALCGGMD
jgi:hypothetical protein